MLDINKYLFEIDNEEIKDDILNNKIKKMNNVILNIKFPFSKENDKNSIKIYENTIEKVLNLLTKESLGIVFTSNQKGILCVESVIELLHNLSDLDRKKVGYPTVDFIFEDSQKSLKLNNKILMVNSNDDKLKINLKDFDGQNYDIFERYLKIPPKNLNELVISIEGNIEYMED